MCWCFLVPVTLYSVLYIITLLHYYIITLLQTAVLVPPLPGAGDPLLRPLQSAQVLRVHHGLPQPQHHQHYHQPDGGRSQLQLRGTEACTQEYQVSQLKLNLN